MKHVVKPIKYSKFYDENLQKIYKTGNMLQYHAFKIYAEVADLILYVNFFNFDNKVIHSTYLGKENKTIKSLKNKEVSTYTLGSHLDIMCSRKNKDDRLHLKGALEMISRYFDYEKKKHSSKYNIIVPTTTDYDGVKVQDITTINKLDYAERILMDKYLPFTQEEKTKEKVLLPDEEEMSK